MRNSILILLSLLTATLLSSQSALTITEIMYNSPGEDLEFIEFYNPSATAIDLSGYQVAEGVTYNFESISLDAASTFVITNDSLKFQRFYGISANQWTSGSLNNGGELISIADGLQDTFLMFEYNDNQPWSQMADGGGSSLVRCDMSNDINLPESWARSGALVRDEEGTPIFADPGNYVGCDLGDATTLAPNTTEMYVHEETGTIEITYYLDNAPDTTTLYVVSILPSSTAERELDYNILTDTLEFNTNRNSDQTLEIEIISDGIDEDLEQIEITLQPINNTITPTETVTVNIISCNSLEASKLKLRGVIHSSSIKAIELIVLEDITREESRTYSLGSANNGGGTDGQEFLLNTEAAAGDCLFVTNDTIRFKQFFGTTDNMQLIQDEELEADYNGNDAIELYQTCNLVDTYGEADVDGEGTEWDYDKGWAKRYPSESSGLVSEFDITEWQFSGKDLLDVDTNSESITPYPLECILTDIDEILKTTNVKIFPNPSSGLFTISSEKTMDNIVIYNLQGQRILKVSELNTTFYTVELEDSHTESIYLIKLEIDGRSQTNKIFID